MGLQLWLPLNGNIRNQGLCDVKIEGNPDSWENGKIGKCGLFNNNYLFMNNYSQNLFQPSHDKSISIACWVKCTGTGNVANSYILAWSAYEFFYSPNEIMFRLGDGNKNTYGVSGTINGDGWHHVVGIWDAKNKKVQIYFDGEFFKDITVSQSINFNSISSSITLPYRYIKNNLSINDFRLYDSALSAREIREIYNNPIVHFPMNNVYELGITNKYSGDFAEGYLYSDYITRSKLPDERGYNYKLSFIGDGDSHWKQINIGNSFSFTAGKTYYYSCKVRCHSKLNTRLYLRAARSANDWVTNMVNVLNDDGQWHEYVISQTINETYDRAGSTMTCSPFVEFYTDNMNENGVTYTFDVDIKDIQVTEDRYYPFIANELVDSTISDTSGYCNNGMVEGGTSPQSVGQLVSQSSITLPRYSSQYYFSGKDYIKFQNPFYGQQLSQLTINFYVNISEGCGNYTTIFSIYGGGVDNRCLWIAVNCEGAGLWGYVNESNSYLYNSGGYLEYNTWHMATFVFKDGKAQWYLDGQKNIEPTAFSAGLITFTDVPTLSIGNSYRGTKWTTDFVGYLSDFRMYANALTETDIKRLYNTSASLDSQGNLMLSGEVVE